MLQSPRLTCPQVFPYFANSSWRSPEIWVKTHADVSLEMQRKSSTSAEIRGKRLIDLCSFNEGTPGGNVTLCPDASSLLFKHLMEYFVLPQFFFGWGLISDFGKSESIWKHQHRRISMSKPKPCTHDVWVNPVAGFSWSLVQEAMVSRRTLPVPMEVVRHHIYQVQIPEKTRETWVSKFHHPNVTK